MFHFNFFWEERTHLDQKNPKIIIWIFFKKKNSPIWRKENLFQDPHALRIVCAIERSVDHCGVSRHGWANQVSCALTCHWSGLFCFFFQYISLFSLFFVFLHFLCFSFFSVVFSVSLCFRCLYLFLYLLQILFLLCFWFLWHFFIFSVSWCLLFFSFFWMFSFLFLFSLFLFFVCDALFFAAFDSFRQNYKSLVSMFAFCSKNPFCQVSFFECPFSNTIFPLCMCLQLCKMNLFSLFFSFLVRGEGRVQKTHVQKYVVYSLSLFFNQFSFFTFFTTCFCFLFLPILMFFSSQKQKYRNFVFICVSHHYFETIHQKCFLTFSLKLKLYFRKKVSSLVDVCFYSLFLHFSIVCKKTFRFHF